MTAVWVVVGLVAAVIVYLRGFVVGTRLGRRAADHDWRVLFRELGEDHGAELAKAEATIDMLRRNDDVAFMAGQKLRADMEQWGVTDE